MLYITATPIGNLKDVSFRALEILKSADVIIAENPSHTRRLLDHYEIKPRRMVQFAEHNELQIIDRLTDELKTSVGCLVSDAGTPAIADPGFRLVRACVEAGIEVVPIPGANAALTALSASGLPTDRFLFVGFLPKTEPKLIKILKQALAAESTLVAYESPQRIKKTLETVAKLYPACHVSVARELTKLHEEFIRGTAGEVNEQLKTRANIKGEITLLISFK